jgi:rod shape-determining protein MreC
MQGHRLQELLRFQQHYVASTVAAQVIGTSGTDQSRVLYIDKGSKDGLKVDQAVITPDGIVGKLRDVSSNTAQVLVINDQSSGAGVLLATTRIRAILHGSQGGRIVISNLTPDERIKPGEQVLTSGGDQVYPRGLAVGTIESIAPDLEHQPYTTIVVKPATNLFQLEEVLVITATQGDLTALAQKDLTQGAVTAKEMADAKAAKAAADEAAAEAAAQSASQIVAERLPSIHDGEQTPNPKGAADAPKPTPNAASAVPKPLPTLHPDRYTPGTTPPASSLTPGAGHPASAAGTPAPPTATGEGTTPPPANRPKKETPKPEAVNPNN